MRTRTNLLPIVLSLAIALCCASATMWAQGVGSTAAGTVVGLVSDQTSAVVPGATVILTDKSTGTSRTTTTNDAGRYIFVNVQPGSYDVSVTKTGFSKAVVTSQTVEVGSTTTENITLQLGTEATVVNVEATGAELQNTNSTVGTTIRGQELVLLPNAGRDSSTMAILQPGTNTNGNTAGASSDQNTFQLDGGSITDDMSGDLNTYVPSFASNVSGAGAYHSSGLNQAPSGVIPTPVESVEEFRVSTANQTADYSQGAGMQVQMVTKRGTNAFHGAAYEYYLSSTLMGANTWDNNFTGTPNPSSHYSRFGANAGGPLLPGNHLGGKTYIFGDYEGYRYPLSTINEHNYPSPLLRSGMIALSGKVVNLNPTATPVPSGMPATFYSTFGVTAGQLIPTTQCSAGPCDPRGIGISPAVKSLWNTYLPLPNDYSSGDGINYGGYKGQISLPQSSNFGVARIDHDFGARNHFNGTYHYYRLDRAVTNQVDVGGFFPGDTKGTYTSVANRPQLPWYITGGLTTNISASTTNQATFSETRNFWAFNSQGSLPNVAGFPGNLEIGGETSSSNWTPFNTNNQSTRWRFWDGHDTMFRDDVTHLRGNHLFQFGGIYQRNYDQHLRIDNGGSINIYQQYLIGLGNSTSQTGVDWTGYTPVSGNKYKNLAAEVLGLVDQTQILYTRSNGSTLPLKPLTSCATSVAATASCVRSPAALNQSIIPSYNLYATDTWHIKPKLTLTYGLSWTVEMPPYEPNGNQDVLVDQSGRQFSAHDYFKAREAAALNGQAYDPIIGFATITNVAGKPKFPYNPYYAGLAPRLAAAWNVTPGTVVRGGYARIYGRINGVDQVLVPILSPGLMQTVICDGPVKGTANTCGGSIANVYRAGVDPGAAALGTVSKNLPQPWFPGVNDVSTGAGEALDPTQKVGNSDEFNLSIQRMLTPKITVEVGAISRWMHNEFQAYNLNAVPYMMTRGGQRFDKAWAAIVKQSNLGANPNAVTAQPFFENALGGPTSAYCSGFANCTTAFANNESANLGCACVWDAWTDVSTAGAWVFGRTMLNDPLPGAFGANGQGTSVFLNDASGYGNYNGAYFTFSFHDWKGLTVKTNMTWSKALGTGAVVQASSAFTATDPYHLNNMYGLQYYDQPLAYNLYLTYTPSWFRDQRGITGHILGGWTFAGLFIAGSGFPLTSNAVSGTYVTSNGSCESYGEGDCNDLSSFENPVITGKVPSVSLHYGVKGSGGIGTAGKGLNAFADPAAVNGLFRDPILGSDGNLGVGGPIRGFGFWNSDLSLTKSIRWSERINTSLFLAFNNVFNHFIPADPTLWNGSDPTVTGVVGSGGNVQANDPRRAEIGLRIGW